MYCDVSGYKKTKTDAETEEEKVMKDVQGFEISYVYVVYKVTIMKFNTSACVYIQRARAYLYHCRN